VHSSDASRNKDLSDKDLRDSDFAYPENRLTRRAKQVHDGIIATIAGVHTVCGARPGRARKPLIDI
jgi:hypothetical protein